MWDAIFRQMVIMCDSKEQTMIPPSKAALITSMMSVILVDESGSSVN